jgi:hypothetical protein
MLADGRCTWAGGLGTTWVNVPDQDLTTVVLTQRAADETGCPRSATKPWTLRA